MASTPERRPAAPVRSGMPVERQETVAEVPEAWLNEPDHLAEAEQIDRLLADASLIGTLAFGGFAGPDWEYFSTELARYGIAVIGAWMGRGLIFQRCKDRGYGGLPELGRPFTDDDITELTGETITKALYHFRIDVLMKQKWDHKRGATLRTYFIGQCLIRFANVYRRWWGNESRARLVDLTGESADLDAFAARASAADTSALEYIQVVEALMTVRDPRVRRAMVLTAAGSTQAEIAAEMNVTEKTVEKMLYNERKRLRDRRAG